jgi:uncharacterized protein YjgD (DUF1641 family)
MAQPIPLNLPPRDPRKELLDRLERAPQEHAEALLESYELLEQLRQAGILHLLRGTLSAGDEILERAAGAATSPQGTRALRNLLILGQMLSSIDPDLLECVAVATNRTLGSQHKPDIEPPGLFALLSQFRQPELRRSVALINRFLVTLGNQLKTVGSNRPQS